MKKPALFIDRDGTINRDCPYCRDPKDLYVYDDATDLIREYTSNGYYVLIITNQSGLNRGYFTLDEFNRFNSALVSEVESKGGKIDHIFYCPHTPEEKCHCRKPEPGLIEQALDKYDIDLSGSVVAGDRDDMEGQLARRFGMKFILLKH